MGFIRFMATTAGRLVGLVAGLLLIVVGLVAGGGWFVLAAVGVFPLLAAAFDVCGGVRRMRFRSAVRSAVPWPRRPSEKRAPAAA
jgi:hypothetical protein